MPIRPRLIACLAVVLLPQLAAAQDSTTRDTIEAASSAVDVELRSFRAMGMAGAFVGGGSGIGSLFHNPATLITAPVYEGAAGYQRNFGSDTNAIGAAIADAKTNSSLAAGFSYSFGFGNDDGLESTFNGLGDEVSQTDSRLRSHDIRAGLSFPVIPQKIAIGAGFHYLNRRQASWRETTERTVVVDIVDADGNPTGDTETRVEVETKDHELSAQGISIDAGILAQIGDGLSLGFAARNLVEIDGDGRGRRLEAGFGGYFDALHLEAAWFTEQDATDAWKHGAAVGLEYVVQTTPVRAGYRYDGLYDAHFVTGGFGFRTEKVGGDLAYEQNVTNSSDRRIGAAISLYF